MVACIQKPPGTTFDYSPTAVGYSPTAVAWPASAVGCPSSADRQPTCCDLCTNRYIKDLGSSSTKLASGSQLSAGEYLWSPNGLWKFIQQSDGNLVLYDSSGTGNALWASGGIGATKTIMQADGNLVSYTDAGDAVWASHTSGSGAYLNIQVRNVT